MTPEVEPSEVESSVEVKVEPSEVIRTGGMEPFRCQRHRGFSPDCPDCYNASYGPVR